MELFKNRIQKNISDVTQYLARSKCQILNRIRHIPISTVLGLSAIAIAAVSLASLGLSSVSSGGEFNSTFVRPLKPLYEAPKYCLSDRHFNKLFEKLCILSWESSGGSKPAKCVSSKDQLLKTRMLDILCRKDDPSRTWKQRYYALESSIRINHFLPRSIDKEMPLRDKNIVVIRDKDLNFKPSSTLQEHYNVFLEDYSSVRNRTICNILDRAQSHAGRPLDAALIYGHGNKYQIALDQWKALNKFSFNLGMAGSCFQKTLKEGAPIFFKSCNTGNRNQWNSSLPTIAEIAAAATGHPVYAPLQALRAAECDFFSSKSTGVMFKCVKSDFFPNDTPEMKPGQYINLVWPICYDPNQANLCPAIL